MHRLAVAGNRHLEDRHAASGDRQPIGQIFRQQHRVADKAVAHKCIDLPAVTPRPFVVIMGGEQNAATGQGVGFA